MSWQEQVKLRYGLSDGKLNWVKLVFLRVLKNAPLKPWAGKRITPKNVPSSEAIECLLEEFWVLGGVALAATNDNFGHMDSPPTDFHKHLAWIIDRIIRQSLEATLEHNPTDEAHNLQEFSPHIQSSSVALTAEATMPKQQMESENDQLQLENLKRKLESELSSLVIATEQLELAQKRLILQLAKTDQLISRLNSIRAIRLSFSKLVAAFLLGILLGQLTFFGQGFLRSVQYRLIETQTELEKALNIQLKLR
jgi:hypothetical protein